MGLFLAFIGWFSCFICIFGFLWELLKIQDPFLLIIYNLILSPQVEKHLRICVDAKISFTAMLERACKMLAEQFIGAPLPDDQKSSQIPYKHTRHLQEASMILALPSCRRPKPWGRGRSTTEPPLTEGRPLHWELPYLPRESLWVGPWGISCGWKEGNDGEGTKQHCALNLGGTKLRAAPQIKG